MKIKIEGCGQEELRSFSGYLCCDKEYEVLYDKGPYALAIEDEDGENRTVLVNHPEYPCAHLPRNARWVKVE